jgi:hypothetical protein
MEDTASLASTAYQVTTTSHSIESHSPIARKRQNTCSPTASPHQKTSHSKLPRTIIVTPSSPALPKPAILSTRRFEADVKKAQHLDEEKSTLAEAVPQTNDVSASFKFGKVKELISTSVSTLLDQAVSLHSSQNDATNRMRYLSSVENKNIFLERKVSSYAKVYDTHFKSLTVKYNNDMAALAASQQQQLSEVYRKHESDMQLAVYNAKQHIWCCLCSNQAIGSCCNFFFYCSRNCLLADGRTHSPFCECIILPLFVNLASHASHFNPIQHQDTRSVEISHESNIEVVNDNVTDVTMDQ